MRGSPDPMHLVISSCSPLTALLLHSSFIHVTKKVVSIEGSIPGSGWSLLPEVEAFVKLFLASINVSFVCSKSNSGSFVGALRTRVSSWVYFPLSSLVVVSLLSTIFTFGSSSHGSDLIIWIFWFRVGWSTPFSRIFTINVGQSTASWSNWAQYEQDILVGLVQSWV